MADYVNSGPPRTTNGTNFACDKGWNDPPSRIFSPTNANRKRIDPRKRVAHDLTSGGTAAGFQQPSPPPPHQQHQPDPFSNGVTHPGHMDRFMPPTPNMPTTSPAPVGLLSHANSNPDLSNIITQLPPDQQSTSMPFDLNAHGQSMVHNPPFAVYNNIPDLPRPHCSPYHQTQTTSSISPQPSSLTMPSANDSSLQQDGRKLSAPTNNLNAIFSQMSTPTMLQSSHLANKSNALQQYSNTAITQVSNNFSGGATISPNTSIQYEPLRNPPTNAILTPPPVSQQRISPTPVIPAVLPDCQLKKSPTVMVAAPPTNGFYANKVSNGSNHSPKNLSPHNSSCNSPVQVHNKVILPNDNELLDEIVGRLLDVCNKCSCVITNKVSDEINKKIQVFKLAWTSGKLSSNVKVQLSSLSQALDKREFSQADSIHKALVVSHSSEVATWMIGIKKLITSYQKVVEDNNKY